MRVVVCRKGFASYFDVVDGAGAKLEGAAWRYDGPYPQAARIANHVSFWKVSPLLPLPHNLAHARTHFQKCRSVCLSSSPRVCIGDRGRLLKHGCNVHVMHTSNAVPLHGDAMLY